jgi:hypothetical protein
MTHARRPSTATITLTAIVAGALSIGGPTTPRAWAAEGGPPPLSAEARRVLDHLQGTLVAKDMSCRMGGERHQVTGKVTCEKAASGRALLCRVRTQIAGLPPYEDVTIFGWDSHGSGYHMYTANTLGETHDHRGNLSGNVLTLEYSGTEGGKAFVETITFDLSTPNQVGFRNVRTSGGQVAMEITGTYRK